MTQKKTTEKKLDQGIKKPNTPKEVKCKPDEISENLMRNSPGLAFIKDLNHRFIAANQSFCDFLDIELKDVIGKTDHDFFPKDEADKFINHDKQVIKSGTSIVFEEMVQSRNKQENPMIFVTEKLPWKDQEGKISGIYGVALKVSQLKYESQALRRAKDIAEKNEQILLEKNKQFEQLNKELQQTVEQLTDLENRMQFALTTSHIGAWDLDLIDHSAFRTIEHDRIFGYEELLPEWTYEIFLDHVVEKDKKQVDEKFQNAVKNKTNWSFECQIKRSDGIYRWIWACGQHKLDDNGDVHRMAGIVQDITDRKLAEELIVKAKEKAEESDRLKSAFLQNMSHEIRTPMNAIIGFTKMLDKPKVSPEKKKSFIPIIVNSTNQLLSIVSDILTISSIDTKQEDINIQSVNVNNLLIELLSIFEPQAMNQNLSLYMSHELDNEQSEIYTDGTKLRQIISNLLSNAIKFTHEGSIEFGYQFNDDYLEFYVKDTGIGIKKHLKEKIFERFRQADLMITKNYGGTGLGLSISKGFVKLLGGDIWVESEINKGSTFYFTIPYKPVNILNRDPKQIQKDKANNTILVAEDEEYNYLLIEEMLCEFNIKVLHAKNGKMAIDICRKNPDIKLVLMDIKMPIMDGHEAAKEIRTFNPDVPIIAQTAYALDCEIKKYGAVFNDYLTKPIDEELLITKFSNYIFM